MFFCSGFKGALSLCSVFLCRCFPVENGGEDSRPRRRPTRRRHWPHFFSSSINVGASISWQLALAKSFLFRTKLGLRYDQESENKKTSLPMNNGEKFVEFKTCVQRSTDRSWGALVRRSFTTRDLSGAVVYNFATQYNVHFEKMHTTIINRQDTCWARLVWKDARPPWIFPATKWRKKSPNSVTVHLKVTFFYLSSMGQSLIYFLSGGKLRVCSKNQLQKLIPEILWSFSNAVGELSTFSFS